MSERELLDRITYNPETFGGKATIRGERLAVQHVLEMMAAGSTAEDLIEAHGWLEMDDIRACLLYAARIVAHERIDAPILASSK